jgi:hypothetical protein
VPEPEPVDFGMQVLFSFDVPVEPAQNAPAVPKKKNKIINNSYRSGDKLKGDEYRFDTQLRVDPGYASSNLSHIYDVENNMVYKRVQDEVVFLMQSNDELKQMLDDDKPKKFNREKANRMFQIILQHFVNTPDTMKFANVIYIFDNVSNLSGLKYASLYDLLETEYKQMLLIELDKSHNILKRGGKTNKLF